MTVNFLNRKKVVATIETIITNSATKEIVLISPFWDIDKHDLYRLKKVGENDKKITIVVADERKWFDKNRWDNIKLLKEIKGVTILEADNLHSKCYYNDFQMVITSMNYHKISGFKNYEMGVTFMKSKEKRLFEKAEQEAQLIIDNAKPIGDIKKALPQKKFGRKKKNYPSSNKYTHYKKKTHQTKKGTTKRGKKSNYSSSKKYIPYHKNGTTKRGKKSFGEVFGRK